MFDFTKALQDAQQVTEQSNSGSKFQYRLLYPGEGSLSFRILLNPKSNMIIRKIVRHTVGNSKIPCMTNFGQSKSDCPICKAAETVYNTVGSVPRGMWAQQRGICFIQYISSTYKIEGIKAGDTALLMVPKTTYESIQEWISNISSGDQGIQAMYDVFCNHQGMELTINRTSDNKYSFMMNPYKKFKSAENDEEFGKLLDSLPDLTEQIIPAVCTDEVMKQIKAAEESIDQTYINARVPQAPQIPTTPTGFNPQMAPADNSAPATGGYVPQGTSAMPQQNQAQEQAQAIPTTKPKPCYGTYNKLQAGTDAVSMALKNLCPTCQYIGECQKFGG